VRSGYIDLPYPRTLYYSGRNGSYWSLWAGKFYPPGAGGYSVDVIYTLSFDQDDVDLPGVYQDRHDGLSLRCLAS